MAKTERKKRPRFTTPRGIFRFPSVVKPDFGTKDYPKPDGVYKTGLIVEKDDALVVDLIEKLDVLHKAAVANGEKEFAGLKVEARKKLGKITINGFFTEQYDPETEEPTGKIIFNFKRKASGKKKDGSTWKADPPFLFDAKGTPIKTKDLQVWGGTVGKVNFEVDEYFIPGTGAVGLSLILKGAQIIKLVNKGEATAAEMGFDAEDDGYEFDADSESNPFGDSTSVGGSPTSNAEEPDDF